MSVRMEIKALIVSSLNLEGRDPGSIGDDQLLFGSKEEGGSLGLDSLDALELAMAIEEKYGVRIPEGDLARPIFKSVATLADFVTKSAPGAT